MTQEQIDEMQKQIRLNEDYQNQLRQEIEEATPFISDVTPVDILKAEYADNFKFSDCFEELQKRYKTVRRLRRDGNCFYRAYLFQTFEAFILNKDALTK
jgi:ubiquitin thioesterase protein OTUB1